MSDAARWKATVHVGGLAPQVTNANVVDAFIPFGEIVDVKLPKPDAPNSEETHKGFAYVEFEDSADVKEAIDNMDQAELFGRTLKVSQAKAPKSAQEGLGSKTAVWDQEGWLAGNAEGEGELQTPSGPDPMQGLQELDVAGPKQQ
ncbi:hypothetical protein MY11210_002624 [Beauveria gryllotalpidicola]